MTELYIIGAGGHGAVVAELADALGHTIAGFIDDNPTRVDQPVLRWRVLGGRDRIPAGATVALGIGCNSVRLALLAEAEARGWTLPILIHPSAVVSPSVALGAGTVVMAQVAVNARARIGAGSILNTACSVDHDCVLGVGVHIAPGVHLSGAVTIGAGTLLGVGSCARPGVAIGAEVVVGAGAVVVRDLPDGVTAVGNPARVRD